MDDERTDRPMEAPDGVYTPAHLSQLEFDYARDLGQPGEFPFTRGIYPTMYRGRLWTMRQYAGFATARETNQRFRYMLERGLAGINIAFDLPTQHGLDSDHPRAQGEVGKVGVPISSLRDMEILFDGIPLEQASPANAINAPAAVILAMYVALAEQQGLPLERLAGSTQNDILKEFIARGTYIFPPLPPLRLVTDVIEFCAERLPRWNFINVCGYHMREAGSTLVEEVGFALADAVTYVQGALDRGLAVDRFAPRFAFNFTAGPTSSGRRRSFARCGGSGPISCASASGPRRRPAGPSGPGRAPGPASSPPSSPRTISSASRSTPSRPCSAARSRSTPRPTTRRSRFPPRPP